jgi:hypothetical protein
VILFLLLPAASTQRGLINTHFPIKHDAVSTPSTQHRFLHSRPAFPPLARKETNILDIRFERTERRLVAFAPRAAVSP